MNKERLLKELLERRQFWDYELENIERLGLSNDRELRGAIAGIDVAIQLIKELDDPAMRDCINCKERTVHIEGRCAICGRN